MNPLVTTSYNLSFVLLSYFISVIGSLVALTAARKIVRPGGQISTVNLGAASIALGGIGVWSMHFIGMLALDLDVGVGYSIAETLVSLAAAIGATALALGFVARKPDSLGRIAGAGALLGCGVAGMHYLGMFGMRFGGYIQWAYDVVSVSIIIAIVAATAALWLAFNTRTMVLRIAASLVMGAAVCAMHYTGMSAAEFICTTANRTALPRGFGIVSLFDLPALVTVISLGMAIVLTVDQVMQRMLMRPR